MFSVVMPVYNHADYVAQSVRSVQRQTCGDWELVIVDDGSTDGSGRVVDDLARGDERIAVIHQPNAGPAAARNTALSRARGDWIAFLDSDDLWVPENLDHYARFIREHPEARFIHGYRHRLNADGSVTTSPGEFQDRPTGTAELFGRMYLAGLCVCIHRKLFEKVGAYDVAAPACEDYDLYLRMSLYCEFYPLNEQTGLRRRHETNISRRTGRSRMIEGEVLRRFAERVAGHGLLDPAAVARRLGRVYATAAWAYLRQRRSREALAAIRRAHHYRRTFRSCLTAVLSCLQLPFARRGRCDLPEL